LRGSLTASTPTLVIPCPSRLLSAAAASITRLAPPGPAAAHGRPRLEACAYSNNIVVHVYTKYTAPLGGLCECTAHVSESVRQQLQEITSPRVNRHCTMHDVYTHGDVHTGSRSPSCSTSPSPTPHNVLLYMKLYIARSFRASSAHQGTVCVRRPYRSLPRGCLVVAFRGRSLGHCVRQGLVRVSTWFLFLLIFFSLLFALCFPRQRRNS
jgi:hypothetical protein